MIIFWILAGGLTVLALLFVLVPLLSPPAADDSPAQDALNLEVFRRRLGELDADLAAGHLDRDRFEAARRDLERELLYDLEGPGGPSAGARPGPADSAAAASPPAPRRAPWLAAALALVLPAGAVLAYLQLGDPTILTRMETFAATQSAAGPHAGGEGDEGMPSLELLVEGLAAKLAADPENLEGWIMLGRTYAAIGQHSKAEQAFERAYALSPEQPDVAVAYAETLARNNGNRLEGRPAELVRTVLAREPEHPSALWLDGMLAYQQGRYADAAETWERVLALLEPSAEEATDVKGMIAEARRRAGSDTGTESAAGTPATAPTAAPDAGRPPADNADRALARAHPEEEAVSPAPPSREGSPPAAAPVPTPDSSAADGPAAPGGTAIRVSVSLAPELAAQVDPQDTVFVFARAASGPPMPLAAQRVQVKDLPATVTLDEGMAMAPGMSLADFPKVVVGARVSKSGQATPQTGDLEGTTGPVDSAASPEVAVRIDRLRP